MSERWISIVIILFVLSLISERVTNFLKLYFPENWQWWNDKVNGGEQFTLRTHSADKREEKLRERRIFLLSLFSGFLVALTTKANLIEIIQSPSEASLFGWGDVYIWNMTVLNALKLTVGCMLTAFFISMGSKFWHDLLDILLYAKNLKQKLSDKNTFQVESPEELDEWLSISLPEVLKEALAPYSEKWLEDENVISVDRLIEDDKGVIEIGVLDPGKSSLPSSIEYRTPKHQKQIKIPVRIRKVEAVQALSGMGTGVCNADTTDNVGTLAVPVCYRHAPSDPLFLSCYHVLKGIKHDRYDFKVEHCEEILHAESEETIGEIVAGRITYYYDAALMKPDRNSDPYYYGPDGGPFKRQTKSLNYGNQLYKWGHVTHRTRGHYSGIADVRIKYDLLGVSLVMRDLIKVTGIGDRFSEKGDSGSAVLNDRNEVVGILVAGNPSTSYVIPIDRILDAFNLKLYTP